MSHLYHHRLLYRFQIHLQVRLSQTLRYSLCSPPYDVRRIYLNYLLPILSVTCLNKGLYASLSIENGMLKSLAAENKHRVGGVTSESNPAIIRILHYGYLRPYLVDMTAIALPGLFDLRAERLNYIFRVRFNVG